jgi:hypothetical protein
VTPRRANGTFIMPGNNAGKPKGTRNLLQRRFIEALARDFEEHGEGIIRVVRIEKPDVYLRLIASVLPREMHYENVSAERDLDDDAIDNLIETLRRRLLEQRAEQAAPLLSSAKKPEAVN